jgi:hypothetical protein
MNITTTDPIVLRVMAMLDQRSAIGLEKYGVSLLDDSRSFGDWCDMAMEEALDKANYLMKIKDEWEKLQETAFPCCEKLDDPVNYDADYEDEDED